MIKILLSLLLIGNMTLASDDHHDENHSHDKKNTQKNSDEHNAENKHTDDEHDDDHHDETASTSSVSKGILKADEHEGFQISNEAEKNFEIKKIKLNSNNTASIPKTAILTTGEEKNIYRYRQQNYKRIDFKVIQNKNSILVIQSNELSPGDEIVIEGIGYLRITEIAAFGGAPEGHSH